MSEDLGVQQGAESSEMDIMSRLGAVLEPELQQPNNSVSDSENLAEESQDESSDTNNESDSEDDQRQGEEPFVELDHLGKKYKVPQSLKTAFEANRTQANKIPQEVVELRKVLHLEKQASEFKRAFEQQAKTELDELSEIERDIAKFKNVDWTALDTDQIVRARQALDSLKDRRDDLKSAVDNKQRQFQSSMVQAMEQAREHGQSYLQKAIPEWSDEQAKGVRDFAKSRGFTDDELSSLYDPRTVHVMWEAMQYRKLQSSKPNVMNKANQAPPVSRPGAFDANQSQSKSKERIYRESLKKTGSVEDAARWLEYRMKRK